MAAWSVRKRYSELRNFYCEFKGAGPRVEFPGRTIRTLSSEQLDRRRAKLQVFLSAFAASTAVSRALEEFLNEDEARPQTNQRSDRGSYRKGSYGELDFELFETAADIRDSSFADAGVDISQSVCQLETKN